MPFNSLDFPLVTTDKYPVEPILPPPRDHARSGNIAIRVDWDNPITKDADGNPIAPKYPVIYNGMIEIGHWDELGVWHPNGPSQISKRADVLAPEVVAAHPVIQEIAEKLLQLQMAFAREDGII